MSLLEYYVASPAMKENSITNPRNWWPYIVSHRQQIWKQLRLVIPYLLIYILLLFILDYFNISTDTVRGYLGALGPIVVPAFVLLQVVSSLTPLPDLPFIAAGVLFFPPAVAFGLVLLGMWIGGFLNFFIARRLGRGFVVSKYPQITDWIDQFTGKYGFEAIIVARSFTFVTFDLVAYAAGISSIRLQTYAFASLISLVPVALNATLVGLALVSGSVFRTFLLIIFTSLLAVSLGWGARRYRLLQELRRTPNVSQ